jgi:hypothetical protein
MALEDKMDVPEQPCAALRGDGRELRLYSDRVVLRNTGLNALLGGREEQTVLFSEIEDVFLYEATDHSENMLKLALRNSDLPIIMGYSRSSERDAKLIHDYLEVNIHREGVDAGVS